MSEEIDPHGANLLLDRRSALLIIGALGGCLGVGQDDPAPDPPERSTEVTITESDGGDGEPEPTTVEASTLVSEHVAALDSEGYRSETTVTNFVDTERVSKEIDYAETVDRAAFEVVENTTQQNGVSEIRYREVDSETTTTVTLDSGREFSFDSTGEFSTSGLALRVTGESVFKQFLMGATLRTTSQSTDQGAQSDSVSADSPIREYEFTDHDHYELESGQLQIDTRDIIQHFEIEWQANDGVRAISVQISDVGSIEIN